MSQPTSFPDHLPWWQTAVVYQLYVRSFADADGDGIGDLRGILAHLDHLVELGVDAVWLNPCYPSPQLDHGYDVSDYCDIDPAYGDLAAFDELVGAAHERGIKVLMDVVPNHCSAEHPWFREALATAPGSPERARFWFRDGRGPDGDEPPNNWPAIFGGSAWTRVTEADGRPGQWYLGVFTPHQPDFDWSNPEVVAMFDEMLEFWFDRGVDGFRADAVVVLAKTDGLPDLTDEELAGDPVTGWRPPNPHHTWLPEGHAAWRHWREVVDRYESTHPGRELVLVAEAYSLRRPDVMLEYANPAEFHQAFAFDLMLAPWNAPAYRRTIRTIVEALLPSGQLPAWTMNNHDVQRSVTRFGRADATTHGEHIHGALDVSFAPVDEAVGTRRARAAAVLELALPGCAYLYAGEELGLPEWLDLPDDTREDPLFLATGGAQLGRDGCRVPLPWSSDAATAFGFSPVDRRAAPWLPQPEWWWRLAVDAQRADPTSTLALYREAIAVRRTLPDLRGPAFTPLLEGDPDLVAFARGGVTVVMNLSSERRELPATLVAGRRIAVTSDPDHTDPSVLPADAAVWLVR
jgi:alpha-glucosidase